MRLVSSLADRMVSALLPQKSAAAGCAPDQYTVNCGPCQPHGQQHIFLQSRKTCNITKACVITCGGCFQVNCGG